MTSKIKLSKIVIQTGENEIPLSMDEARELYEQLDTLFGKKTVVVPGAPIVIERDRWQNPYRPFWNEVPIAKYSTGTSNEIKAPQKGGLDVQCSVKSSSGLLVSYCGEKA